MSKIKQEQLNVNYEAFLAELPSVLEEHRGRYALMRDGNITAFFDSYHDALTTGCKIFSDSIFSVHQVGDMPIDFESFYHGVARCEGTDP